MRCFLENQQSIAKSWYLIEKNTFCSFSNELWRVEVNFWKFIFNFVWCLEWFFAFEELYEILLRFTDLWNTRKTFLRELNWHQMSSKIFICFEVSALSRQQNSYPVSTSFSKFCPHSSKLFVFQYFSKNKIVFSKKNEKFEIENFQRFKLNKRFSLSPLNKQEVFLKELLVQKLFDVGVKLLLPI